MFVVTLKRSLLVAQTVVGFLLPIPSSLIIASDRFPLSVSVIANVVKGINFDLKLPVLRDLT